jgi:two-component system sensor histidine kinase DesK
MSNGSSAGVPARFENGGRTMKASLYRRSIRGVATALHVGAAAGVVPAVLLAFVVRTNSGPLRWLAVTAVVVLAATHLVGFWQKRARFPKTVTAVHAAAGYLPTVALGPSWLPATGYLAATVLLVWRPARAVPAAVLICVLAGVLSGLLAETSRFVAGIGYASTTALIGLSLCGVVFSARLAEARDEEYGELEQRAVADERRRFARDLHDMLGLSLSAITLKGELVDRLIAQHPDRAKAELDEMLTLSRKALADVRAISTNYRELSLDDECRVAVAVLRAAGAEASIDRPPASLPPRVALVLAAVLREGVTNVVRHSSATRCHCRIEVADGVASLEVVNDGVTAEAPPADDCGAGLRNLRDRVNELNGFLTVGADTDGMFRLRASIPLPAKRSRRSFGRSVAHGL